MARRTGRTDRRRTAREVRITPRDLELLLAIGRMRYATTAQLARLGFNGSVWAARKRLRRVFDAGFLSCWAPRLEAPNIYALSPRGARVVGHPGPDGEPWPAPRGLDRRLEHALAINSIRVALAVTLESEGAVIDWWKSDVELARRRREGGIPDALFRLVWPDTHHTFALEVDRTPPAPQAFARRLFRYQSVGVQAFGVEDFTLLVVGSTTSWTNRARHHAARLALPLRVSFSTFDEIDRGGSKAAWVTALGNVQPSLRAVASARKARPPEVRCIATATPVDSARDPIL